MTKKTDQELIQEWLKSNEVEILPEIKQKDSSTNVCPMRINSANIISIGEAINKFGEKQKRTVRKKKKIPDISKIDKDLIPESLHEIMNLLDKNTDNNNVKESIDEADRN